MPGCVRRSIIPSLADRESERVWCDRKGEWGMSLVSFVDTPKFEDYKERFKDYYKLTRRPDGIDENWIRA